MDIKLNKQLQYNFPRLSDNLLVEAYKKAIDLNLDKDFILLLKTDLNKRTLSNKDNEQHSSKPWIPHNIYVIT